MSTFTPLCLCFLLVGQTGGDEEVQAQKKAIHTVLIDQVTSWNKGDLKGFMAGYQKGNDVTFYSGKNIVKGWDAMLERYQQKYQGEGKEMGKLTFRDVVIDVLSADNAVVRGRWDLKMSKASPGGLFTLLLRKTTDGWRIVHDHTSD
jgi:ketosteroid isomerase-like protein